MNHKQKELSLDNIEFGDPRKEIKIRLVWILIMVVYV